METAAAHDSDEACYPQQALPIGQLSVGEKPQDGLQYLSLVHSEARVIPDVMAVDRSLFENGNEDLSQNSETQFKLPVRVVKAQVHKFSQLRQYCCRMKKLHPSKLLGDAVEVAPSKKLFDEAPCLAVILSLSQVMIFELLEYVEEVCLSEDKASRLPRCISSWIFSLLAVVDKPVPMDYMAIIRYEECLILQIFN